MKRTEHKSLREMANEEMEAKNTGRDPEGLDWPRCMPRKVITVHGKEHECARRFRRLVEPVMSPRRSPCPCCGKQVPVDQTVSQAYYETDTQNPWAAWVSEQIHRCASCGDKHHDGVIWIVKPDGWDAIVWPDPHADDEPAPGIVYDPDTDPDNQMT